MIVRCVWHPGGPIALREVPPLEDEGSTDGMCAECAENAVAELKAAKARR